MQRHLLVSTNSLHQNQVIDVSVESTVKRKNLGREVFIVISNPQKEVQICWDNKVHSIKKCNRSSIIIEMPNEY